MSTIHYLPDDEASLKLSRSKKFSDLNTQELKHFASKALLPEKLVLDTAKQTVESFDEVWNKEKHHLPLTQGMIDTINNHLKTIPLYQGK